MLNATLSYIGGLFNNDPKPATKPDSYTVPFGQAKSNVVVTENVESVDYLTYGAIDERRKAKKLALANPRMRMGKRYRQQEILERNAVIKKGPVFDRLVKSSWKNVKIENVPKDFVELQPMTSFFDGSLYRIIEAALRNKSYLTPTAVQSFSIPYFLETDNDLIVCAQTGVGKSAAFLIPLIQKVIDLRDDIGMNMDRELKSPFAIILVPSRELAGQIYRDACALSKNTDLRIHLGIGELFIKDCKRELEKGCDILIGTQGRICHYFFGINSAGDMKHLDFYRTKYLILDEVDRALDDPNFFAMLKRLVKDLKQANPKCRIANFTATIDKHNIGPFVRPDYIQITVGKINRPTLTILQTFILVQPKRTFKLNCLLFWMERLNKQFMNDPEKAMFIVPNTKSVPKTLIYVNTKTTADFLPIILLQKGYRALSINSDLSPEKRKKSVKKLRDGEIDILVATDIASRGLNIENIEVVINYDLPISMNFNEYIHRVGRTGRMGNYGRAISFFDPMSDINIAWRLAKLLESTNQPVPSFLKPK